MSNVRSPRSWLIFILAHQATGLKRVNVQAPVDVGSPATTPPDCSWVKLLAKGNSRGMECDERGTKSSDRKMGTFRSDDFVSPKRIGLVIRGESYRGGGGQGDRNDTITPDGLYWQNLASKSHLEKIIWPMEACNFSVDVFIGTYDHTPGMISKRPIQDLLLRYAPRVRDSLTVPPEEKHVLLPKGGWTGSWGAATMYHDTFRLLFNRHNKLEVDYDAVLVIRHDMVFKQPIMSSFAVDWGRVVFPFREKIAEGAVSDTLQWFPRRYLNCASMCGYRGHYIGTCLTDEAKAEVAHMWAGVHTSNTENEANPIYVLARPLAGEQKTAVLVVGDVGDLPRQPGQKPHAKPPSTPLRVTGAAFRKHILEANNRRIFDLHKKMDVFLHSWVPGLKLEFNHQFQPVLRASYDKRKDMEAELNKKLGGGITDIKDVQWAYSLQKAFEMMLEAEAFRGRYSRVLIVRPDTLLLSDLVLDEMKGNMSDSAVYTNRKGRQSSKYLHFAMGRSTAMEFASLYRRLPFPASKKGRDFIVDFVEKQLNAEMREDNITVGVDEEAYPSIPMTLSRSCEEEQLVRMRAAAFTSQDAQELQLSCPEKV